MKKILIRVTADDIAQGCERNGDNCPIARAILRRLRKPFVVFVGSNIAFDTVGNKEIVINPLFSIEHTSVTKRFVANFDSYSHLHKSAAKPFDFLLDVPSKWGFMFKR